MPLPIPVPGFVVRYSYLWHSEHLAGREEGQKDRLCVIVVALRPAEEPDKTRILVLLTTHSPPIDAACAIEIPARIKELLGLDVKRSWVMFSEWKKFI